MGMQGLHPFYIYGSHTEDAIECASREDVTARFKQMLASARRRGDGEKDIYHLDRGRG
jgi:hypothetical protein